MARRWMSEGEVLRSMDGETMIEARMWRRGCRARPGRGTKNSQMHEKVTRTLELHSTSRSLPHVGRTALQLLEVALHNKPLDKGAL